MFGAGLLALWLLISGYSIRNLSARAIMSLTGHLRAHPDPCLEWALREAFDSFDRELTAILQDDLAPPRRNPVLGRDAPEEPPGLRVLPQRRCPFSRSQTHGNPRSIGRA
jgi:hypothetical protein